MNVECQAIRVPTGVQDYRPALYGGVAAIELRRGRDQARRTRRRRDRARAPHRARLHRRAAPLGHQQLGDHPAPHRRRPAHLRLLRADPRHGGGDARRARSAATGTKSAGRSPSNGTTGSGWRPASPRRPSRTSSLAPPRPAPPGRKSAAPGEAAVCSATARPAARAAIAEALAAGGARLLDYRVEAEGLRLG